MGDVFDGYCMDIVGDEAHVRLTSRTTQEEAYGVYPAEKLRKKEIGPGDHFTITVTELDEETIRITFEKVPRRTISAEQIKEILAEVEEAFPEGDYDIWMRGFSVSLPLRTAGLSSASMRKHPS